MSAKHPTKVEREARVTEVFKMLVSGLGRPEVLRLVQARYDWGVAVRTIDSYIAAARERFEELSTVRREEELGKAIARLDQLYAKAVAANDIKGALAVERQRITLLGLQAPERIEITEVLPFLDAEIARRRREVEQLERQYAMEPAQDAPAGA